MEWNQPVRFTKKNRELTLYLIQQNEKVIKLGEQNKELESLKQEIDELKALEKNKQNDK